MKSDRRLAAMSLRSIDVLANNGLTVKLEMAVRYHADYRRLPLLHRTIGPDYLERVVIPQTVAAVREAPGRQAGRSRRPGADPRRARPPAPC